MGGQDVPGGGGEPGRGPKAAEGGGGGVRWYTAVVALAAYRLYFSRNVSSESAAQ